MRKDKKRLIEHIANSAAQVGLMLAAHGTPEPIIRAQVGLMLDVDCTNGAPDQMDVMGLNITKLVREEFEECLDFYGEGHNTVLGQGDKLDGNWVYTKNDVALVREAVIV